MSRKKKETEWEKNPTILVVDDNQENLELLQAYLEDLTAKQSLQSTAYRLLRL